MFTRNRGTDPCWGSSAGGSSGQCAAGCLSGVKRAFDRPAARDGLATNCWTISARFQGAAENIVTAYGEI